MLQQRLPDLPHLIRLGVATVALQIDSLRHTRFPEYVVASTYPLDKPHAAQQPAQIVESNPGIRATTEYPADKLLPPAHVPVPAFTDPGTLCMASPRSRIAAA